MIKRTKFNVSLLGDTSVGKTCMINSLKGFPFDANQIATIGIDDVMDEAKFENVSYKFKIFDTAGQERYNSISTQTIQLADGFLIVFAVDNPDSFDKISLWIETIEDKVNINQKAIILVGNKCDIKNEERKIDKSKAEEFANSHKMKYYETSAKTGENIKIVFNQLYTDIYNLSKKLEKKEDNIKLTKKNNNDNDQENNGDGKTKKKRRC